MTDMRHIRMRLRASIAVFLTIEELCYYLCNNLYLIDYTIMNGQLCDWLDEELEMKALASELRDVLRLHGSLKSLF